MAIAAGTTTATAPSTNSATAAGRRRTAGSPAATMPSTTAEPTTANSVPRDPGTASAFQMPPIAARLPSVPSPGSARAANAAIPLSPDDRPENTLAVSHGNAASTATPRPAAAQSHRGRPPPGTTAHTSATVAASIRPVGVNPATAVHHTSAHQLPDPSRSFSIASATHGRHP